MSKNPLADDIEAEYAQVQSEKRNAKNPGWKASPSLWESRGYVAKVQRTYCQCCDGFQDLLLGIFHRETSGESTRDTAFSLRSPLSISSGRVEKTTEWSQTLHVICPNCLPFYGFPK